MTSRASVGASSTAVYYHKFFEKYKQLFKLNYEGKDGWVNGGRGTTLSSSL